MMKIQGLYIQKNCYLDDESETYYKSRAFNKEQEKALHFYNNLNYDDRVRLLRKHLALLFSGDEFIALKRKQTIETDEDVLIVAKKSFAKTCYGAYLPAAEYYKNETQFKHELTPDELSEYKSEAEKALNGYVKRLNKTLDTKLDKFLIVTYWGNR